MRYFVFALIMILAGVPLMPTANAAAAQGRYMVPAPSWNHPRRIVFQIDSGKPARMNLVLNNVNNIIKYYGQDNVKVAVVAFGPGLPTLLKTSPVAARVESLTAYSDVSLLACRNTMRKMHKTKADLLPGIKTVPTGVASLVEHQMAGWTYIAP